MLQSGTLRRNKRQLLTMQILANRKKSHEGIAIKLSALKTDDDKHIR